MSTKRWEPKALCFHGGPNAVLRELSDRGVTFPTRVDGLVGDPVALGVSLWRFRTDTPATVPEAASQGVIIQHYTALLFAFS